MIPEIAAAAFLFRRITDDGFVRAADDLVPLPTEDLSGASRRLSRMTRGAAVSLVGGAVPPLVALLCFPPPVGFLLATATAFAVSCDWLLSFCGARVSTQSTSAGTLFHKVPFQERRTKLPEAFLRLAFLALAATFAYAAVAPF